MKYSDGRYLPAHSEAAFAFEQSAGDEPQGCAACGRALCGCSDFAWNAERQLGSQGPADGTTPRRSPMVHAPFHDAGDSL